MLAKKAKEVLEAIRDKEMALRILTAAQITGKTEEAKSIWPSFTKKERTVILNVLQRENRGDLTPLMSQGF